MSPDTSLEHTSEGLKCQAKYTAAADGRLNTEDSRMHRLIITSCLSLAVSGFAAAAESPLASAAWLAGR